MSKRKVLVSVRFSEDERALVRVAAKKADRTVTNFIVVAALAAAKAQS